jgi:biopolymer transport protein ExbD
MKLRKSRASRHGRIEIIPMIDVMFFLLATFILASLSVQHLHSIPVNLPQGQADPFKADKPVTLTVSADSKLFIDQTPVTLENLAAALKPHLQSKDATVVMAADSAAPNGITVQAMLQARAAGAQHFLIAVKHGQ